MIPLFLFVLTALRASHAATSFEECPPNVPANYYLQIYGDYCYQFVFFERRDYQGALDYCNSFGGTLALAKSSNITYFLENEIVHRYYRHLDVWIGLNNLGGSPVYKWEDGSPLVYTNWSPQEDLSSGIGRDRCVSLDPSEGGRWHLNPCLAISPEELTDFGKTFVCQYSRVPFSSFSSQSSGQISGVTDITAESPSTVATLTLACPAFSCDLDCGMDGFKKNATTECSICECYV
ncbi:macrophage mannose receptor 1-like [Biomphalaria glabrata]|uniref:Macrophage mannose receptor 1-like n=2 Tax=Biomphalaria glabrata TaxID=6526 RepID=A0A9W2ZZP2_BIOGL|nr:macrophage mannose receptor 1-like [Biomphalaria glabrata]